MKTKTTQELIDILLEVPPSSPVSIGVKEGGTFRLTPILSIVTLPAGVNEILVLRTDQ